MLCLSGFEVYSRWVPLMSLTENKQTNKNKTKQNETRLKARHAATLSSS